ncbi:hypothetical protein V8G54_008529 [Vigna mungo]|uniref:Uncharacterized protein n=1 Tax=Vigna mungo TaxID=3915 RepID=A0AAQ3P5S3_VIGMU
MKNTPPQLEKVSSIHQNIPPFSSSDPVCDKQQVLRRIFVSKIFNYLLISRPCVQVWIFFPLGQLFIDPFHILIYCPCRKQSLELRNIETPVSVFRHQVKSNSCPAHHFT